MLCSFPGQFLVVEAQSEVYSPEFCFFFRAMDNCCDQSWEINSTYHLIAKQKLHISLYEEIAHQFNELYLYTHLDMEISGTYHLIAK